MYFLKANSLKELKSAQLQFNSVHQTIIMHHVFMLLIRISKCFLFYSLHIDAAVWMNGADIRVVGK